MITTLLHIAIWLLVSLAVTFNSMLWRLLRDTRGVTRLCHALREVRDCTLEQLRHFARKADKSGLERFDRHSARVKEAAR